MVVALVAAAIVVLALLAEMFAPAIQRLYERLKAGREARAAGIPVYDPGRERRAEARARELLLPRATVITPNVPEARVLAPEIDDGDLPRALHALGPDVVVLTGGHRDEATDLFFDGTELHAIPGPRHPDGAAHGSGCTHSSTLAARLARGDSLEDAARRARETAARAVRDGLRDLGDGAGPVDVMGLPGRQVR